jgi:hypothetical protein
VSSSREINSQEGAPLQRECVGCWPFHPAHEVVLELQEEPDPGGLATDVGGAAVHCAENLLWVLGTVLEANLDRVAR